MNVLEKDFQKTVIEMAKSFGWICYHAKVAPTPGGRGWATPVQGDGKGFPDLVLVRERLIFAELKAQKGSLRPEQRVWLNLLSQCGQEVYVWKPSDIETVKDTLILKKPCGR